MPQYIYIASGSLLFRFSTAYNLNLSVMYLDIMFYMLIFMQLEKERCDLLEELQLVRDELSSAKREFEQKSDQLKQLSTNYDKQTKSLNEQITEVTLFCLLVADILPSTCSSLSVINCHGFLTSCCHGY